MKNWKNMLLHLLAWSLWLLVLLLVETLKVTTKAADHSASGENLLSKCTKSVTNQITWMNF